MYGMICCDRTSSALVALAAPAECREGASHCRPPGPAIDIDATYIYIYTHMRAHTRISKCNPT